MLTVLSIYTNLLYEYTLLTIITVNHQVEYGLNDPPCTVLFCSHILTPLVPSWPYTPTLFANHIY